jgi:quercetin dioxygenase-like cupin family protein
MTRLGFAIVLTTMLAGAAIAAGAGAGTSTLTSAADLKWIDVPDRPGVQIAPVDGNPAKGPSHFYVKMKAGFESPLHHHTADHYVAVISGTMLETPEGGTETKLGPGSFFAFTKKAKHTTKCDAASDCLLFIDARGKWDVVDAKKPEPKK